MTDERIIHDNPLTRVTAKIAPTPLPWDVLTAEDAREIADTIARNVPDVWWLDEDWAQKLRAYADAVDAMAQPTRIEYTTEDAS